jgi:hypothetical protein
MPSSNILQSNLFGIKNARGFPQFFTMLTCHDGKQYYTVAAERSRRNKFCHEIIVAERVKVKVCAAHCQALKYISY